MLILAAVYMEYIVRELTEKNKKREYINICTNEKMESYVKNLEDYQMINELLGEYGWNSKRRHLFKIAEIDYETAIIL